MTEDEIRELLRKINYVGVPINIMARDAGVSNATMKRLLTEQEVWHMRPSTKEILEDYINWFKNTLGLN